MRKQLQCGHKYDRVTPPCPPAGAMIRRKKSVLFNVSPCTRLKLPASSFAIFSKASRILSKGPFRRAYFNLEDSFVLLPVSVFERAVSKSHHFGVAVCLRTTFFLFQKFFRHPLETFTLSLSREKYSTFLEKLVFKGVSSVRPLSYRSRPSKSFQHCAFFCTSTKASFDFFSSNSLNSSKIVSQYFFRSLYSAIYSCLHQASQNFLSFAQQLHLLQQFLTAPFQLH